MRRMFFFASRNRKEMLRDPLSLIFGVGFPVVLLILLLAAITAITTAIAAKSTETAPKILAAS